MLGRAAKIRAIRPARAAVARHSPKSALRRQRHPEQPDRFFVLVRALHDIVPDSLWWMSAFGARFSCHGALLEVKKT
jgi:alkylresorcinol/alkylpyrone synthase